MSIPKLLHQTWKTRDVPHRFRAYYDSWRRIHRDWEFRLYDNDECRQLVNHRYPHLLAAYDRLPTDIQRADLFRYLVVHEFGGVYADLDMECYKSIDSLLESKTCVLSIEATFGDALRRRLRYRFPFQIANCIFAAVPQHPLFRRVLEQLAEPASATCYDALVEDTTGPRFLTRLFQSSIDEYPDVTLLPQIHWLPPSRPAYPNIFPFNMNIYCKHHFAGTWKTGSDDVGGPKTWKERFRERWYLPSPWLPGDFSRRALGLFTKRDP